MTAVKIVVFGLSISSSWGNGHATLWRGLVAALARRGHRVVFFERDVSYYAENRDYTDLPGGELVFYTDWDAAAPTAREHLADADAALVTSYCPDGQEACRLMLDAPVPVKAFYDLDTPVTLDALRAGKPVDYLPVNGLGDFDLVLSYTGGAALTALQRDLGARRVFPLYGSVDTEVHRPVLQLERFRADLSYLGTYAEDRQAALIQLFIEPAQQMPHQRFLLGGAMYPADFPWTNNIFFVRHLPPYEHPAFYSSSRLTLNVTRRAMKEMGYCPSGRLFEAAACGCALLSDTWEGLEQFYTPGQEILIGESSPQAIAALELSDAELTQIARNARERTLAEHTADKRAEELVNALQNAYTGEASLGQTVFAPAGAA